MCDAITESSVGPDFLIVGAHKAGTTSLFQCLLQHPSIDSILKKEPHFYCYEKVKGKFPGVIDDIGSYSSLLSENRKSGNIVGEASVFYLYYYKESISNILKSRLGRSTKIIIILRDPVSRAFSAYIDEVSKGEVENLDFYRALMQEELRLESVDIPPSMFYRDVGLYDNAVRSYLDNFDEVYITTFEKLTSERSCTLGEVQKFLGLESFPLSLPKANSGRGTWSNPALGTLIKGLVPRNVRPFLKAYFPSLYPWFKQLIVLKLFNKNQQIDARSKIYLESYFMDSYTSLKKMYNLK